MYSIAHSHPSRSFRASHLHLQVSKISYCPCHFSGRSMAPLQFFSQPQIPEHTTETANFPLLSECRPSRGFLDTQRGAEKRSLLWDCSWSSLERQSAMTSHNLLLFISTVQKKNKNGCLTSQTNHTDFGYKAHCKFAQFREDFSPGKFWQATLQHWKNCRRDDLFP